MKKLFCLAVFSMALFVAAQAQSCGILLVNNSSATYNLRYVDGNNNTNTIFAASNNSASDYIANFDFDLVWTSFNNANACVAGPVTITTAPSNGSQDLPCATPYNVTWTFVATGGGALFDYLLTVTAN